MAYKNTKRKQKSTELIQEANTKTNKNIQRVQNTQSL